MAINLIWNPKKGIIFIACFRRVYVVMVIVYMLNAYTFFYESRCNKWLIAVILGKRHCWGWTFTFTYFINSVLFEIIHVQVLLLVKTKLSTTKAHKAQQNSKNPLLSRRYQGMNLFILKNLWVINHFKSPQAFLLFRRWNEHAQSNRLGPSCVRGIMVLHARLWPSCGREDGSFLCHLPPGDIMPHISLQQVPQNFSGI